MKTRSLCVTYVKQNFIPPTWRTSSSLYFRICNRSYKDYHHHCHHHYYICRRLVIIVTVVIVIVVAIVTIITIIIVDNR